MIVTAQASFVIHLSNYSPSAHMTAQLTSTSHLPIIQLCKHLQRTSQQVQELCVEALKVVSMINPYSLP